MPGSSCSRHRAWPGSAPGRFASPAWKSNGRPKERSCWPVRAMAPSPWESAFAALEEPYRRELRDRVAACVAHDQAFRMEARLTLQDGQERWLQIIGEPEPSVTGPRRRVIGAVKDVTERKVAARRLHELNQQLATTFESITSGFYTLDRHWRFTYANHETERVARRSRSELLGRSIMELFPWFVGSRLHQEYERAISGGGPAHFQVFLDALGVWGEVHAYPSAQGLAVYFQDITDRKLAQDALRASEERHRLLFEVSLDALLQLERQSGRIVAANPRGLRDVRAVGGADSRARHERAHRTARGRAAAAACPGGRGRKGARPRDPRSRRRDPVPGGALGRALQGQRWRDVCKRGDPRRRASACGTRRRSSP